MKKGFLGMAFFVLFFMVVQVNVVHAQFYGEFQNYVKQKNWSRMERVLRNNRNRITNIDRSMCPYIILRELRGDEAIRGLELLRNYNINPDTFDLGTAFENQPDNVIDYLFGRGLQATNSAFPLKAAIRYKRFNFVPRLLTMLDPSKIDDRTTRANSNDPDSWTMAQSYTALIFAVQAENFDTVRRLVELGANVNLRADDGSTAASLAYDNGLINIYNYLKENGAIDFEPRQVVQQSQQTSPQTSTTNVYVQPSAPAQSSPPPAPSTPTLQTGSYSWANSRTNMTMSLLSPGQVSAYFNNLPAWSGTYRINGNQLVISVTIAIGDYATMRGQTYTYNITSSTSFSGSGETWVRTGL